MSREFIRVENDIGGRYYSLWYNSRFDAAITVKRINSGIDFRANKEARKQMSANTYLLYMSLITLPTDNQWLLSEINPTVNTVLTEDDIVHGLEELSELGYLVLTDKRRSAITILEAPRLKSRL